MGPCHAQGGPSTDRTGPASSWKDASFRQMTTAPLCFVIWCAHRWGDMSILTTVVVTPAIIQRHSISTREWSQTPMSQKIGSPTVFTGAEWVSSLYEGPTGSCSINDQVSKVMGTTTRCCLHSTNLYLQTRILVKTKRILRSGTKFHTVFLHSLSYALR